jgi:ADP-heptose:LPS heptosyltransferase/predicted SAM-dependent methyltransferase
MAWRIDGPQGYESAKIRWNLVPYTRGKGLDVGCGLEKPFHHFIGVDNGHHFGRGVADIVSAADDLRIFADASLDFVFSSHTLEHMKDHVATLAEWWRVVKDGGHLVLYLPHKNLYPNIGQEGANPDHKHDFLPEDIIAAMREVAAKSFGWDLLENETRDGGNEYSFFQVYRKRGDRECQTDTVWQRNPEGKKRCLVIRYGAIGDLIQTASVLPLLKAQGYHITVNTTPFGAEIMRHDPHIDEFLLQDKDQVPNEELGDYFASLEARYDRIVNFTESVEGALLAMPKRAIHRYSYEARRRVVGKVNYLERMHDIADVPYEFRPYFYPSAKEMRDASALRQRMGGGFIVMWVQSGSSVHKTYPHTHVVVSWLLQHTDARVLFVGDKRCQLADRGICELLVNDKGHKWEDTSTIHMQELAKLVDRYYGERRVFPWSGQWTVRETLAFAQHASVVVGPETGVLNAVSMLPQVGKVVMLSHSSVENLTKHWKNTISLQPVNTPCWPCHQLHYGWDFCHQDSETKAAKCMASITPERVFEVIRFFAQGRKAA